MGRLAAQPAMVAKRAANMRGGQKPKSADIMKNATIIEWDEVYRMGCGCDNWTERVPARAAESNAVRISGGFRSVQSAVAIRDGRIVAVRVAEECTWWDDPITTQFIIPDDDETVAVVGWCSENADAEWIRGVTAHNLSVERLRAIGAWRDAKDAERREAAARRARWEAIVAKANAGYGRFADLVLDAHIYWSCEDQVIDLAKLLVEAPAVARALQGVPGGCKALRVLGEFDPVDGPDYLAEAMCRISGPRCDSAIEVANLLLDRGCVRLP